MMIPRQNVRARGECLPVRPTFLVPTYRARAASRPRPRPKSCNPKQRSLPPSLPPSLLLHSHPPWRFAKIMSTCSMQKAKSYLPTRGGGGGPGRQAVRLRHGHSAVSVRIQEEEVHARGREGGKKGLNLGKVQYLSSSSLKCFEFK